MMLQVQHSSVPTTPQCTKHVYQKIVDLSATVTVKDGILHHEDTESRNEDTKYKQTVVTCHTLDSGSNLTPPFAPLAPFSLLCISLASYSCKSSKEAES
jgi:hypothetical protein